MTLHGLQFGAEKILGGILGHWSLLLTPFEAYPDFYVIKLALCPFRFVQDWAM